MTDLSKTDSDFEINITFRILHFLALHFYKFLVKKKKNHAQYTQIGMIFFKLIAQKFWFFNFGFYLTP